MRWWRLRTHSLIPKLKLQRSGQETGLQWNCQWSLDRTEGTVSGLSLWMWRSLGHEPPRLLSLMPDGMSCRRMGDKGPLLASITGTQTLALLFFLTTMDAEEVKDKRMASGVQFMKNIEPSEEESAGIEKNRGEVASSSLFPTCVAWSKVNRHSNRRCVCLPPNVLSSLNVAIIWLPPTPHTSILQILIKAPGCTGKVGNPCAE